MSTQPSGVERTYEVCCHRCTLSFDALGAPWCDCQIAESSFRCPHCSACSCDASPGYGRAFWSEAPPLLWRRKWEKFLRDWASAPEPAARIARPLILCIDEDLDAQSALAQTAENLGCGLLVANDGTEGLALARTHVPDLILVDALVPQIDGREMSHLLKERADTARIKMVITTCSSPAFDYNTEAYHEFHVDDYLCKPIVADALRGLIEKHICPSGAPQTGAQDRVALG